MKHRDLKVGDICQDFVSPLMICYKSKSEGPYTIDVLKYENPLELKENDKGEDVELISFVTSKQLRMIKDKLEDCFEKKLMDNLDYIETLAALKKYA